LGSDGGTEPIAGYSILREMGIIQEKIFSSLQICTAISN
jgi:hypothetical protein